MKSVVIMYLAFIMLSTALHSKNSDEWNSSGPAKTKDDFVWTSNESDAPADSTTYKTGKYFITKTEYNCSDITSKTSVTSTYSSNTLGIPLGRCEAAISFDKFDYKYRLPSYWERYYLSVGNYTTAEFMLKYRIRNNWKVGVAAIFKENDTEKITFDHLVKLELSKQAMSRNAQFGFIAFIEESLEKGFLFTNGYVEPTFYSPNKDLIYTKHHWGLESYYCLSQQADLVNVGTKYPLTYAPNQSVYLAVRLDYTYCNRNVWHYKADDYYYAREGWLEFDYKFMKQLEFSLDAVLTESNCDYARERVDSYDTWLETKPGITAYVVEYKGASLMFNTSLLHAYNKYEMEGKDEYSYNLLMPSVILMYKFDKHLQINSQLTQNYYLDKDDDFYGIKNKPTLDFSLGLTAEL